LAQPAALEPANGLGSPAIGISGALQ
jgi:hypothetical protein